MTFATLGLSEVELILPTERSVRMELLLSCYQADTVFSIPGLMTATVTEVMRSGRGPARGGVLGPAGPVFPEAELTALYVTIPVFFPEESRSWNGSEPPTVLAQLIPISDDEAAMVKESGWEVFEDHLEHSDSDLFDLRRGSSL